jgi:hypothetical protein
MGLDAGLPDPPRLRPATVRQMAHEPVAGHRGRDPHADTPDHEAPAAEQIEADRDRNLLQHPCPFEEAVEPVELNPVEVEGGGARQL